MDGTLLAYLVAGIIDAGPARLHVCRTKRDDCRAREDSTISLVRAFGRVLGLSLRVDWRHFWMARASVAAHRHRIHHLS